MPRSARVVFPGLPHHVTQRGNRREPIFFEAGDQDLYLRIMSEQIRRFEVEVWAYCLMPNHVHLIMTPADEFGLGWAVGEAHRRYTTFVNARQGWRGHLFQDRFASVAMGERHLRSAVRYVAMNPVRAGLVARAVDWPWSSAAAHLAEKDDVLVCVRPLVDLGFDFEALFDVGSMADQQHESVFRALRRGDSRVLLEKAKEGDGVSCPMGHDTPSPASHLLHRRDQPRDVLRP